MVLRRGIPDHDPVPLRAKWEFSSQPESPPAHPSKTLKKIHPILTYGVGVSIVQFTDDAKIELELKNRIPSSAIIKNIDKITLKGFY